MTLAIVNARGVPGAAGAIARDREGQRFLCTCNHVLFGAGAGVGDTVWAMEDVAERGALTAIARTSHGYQGQILHDGSPCFIDFAFAEFCDDGAWPNSIRHGLLVLADVGGVARCGAGARVSKRAWLTGHTHGTVIDDRHFDRPTIDGRAQPTPAQLLIRSTNTDERFSALGESGAAVLDEQNRVVGFLWGCNTYGEGIAFPALAMLEYFGMTVECRTRGSVSVHV
jgi:hypothetical protein